MTEKGPPRWLVLGGVVYVILGVLGTVVAGDTPDFVDDPAKIAAFYKGESDSVLASQSLYLLAGFFLLWFVAGLRSGLERADGAGSPLAAVALIGGAAGTALMIGGAAIGAVGGLRADEQGSIDPQTAAALYDIGNVMFGLAAPMAWAAAVLATAMVALRSSALPSWLGWVSILMGIALLIPPINFFSIIVMGLWIIAVAILLYIRSGGEQAGTPVAAYRRAAA